MKEEVGLYGDSYKKIPFWKKVSYGLGAAGGNVMNTMMAAFLLSYYTDTVYLNAAAIGTMFIVTRLLDGVTDLGMGALIDRTNSKIGKARPWLILSAPLIGIGIILILSVPESLGNTAKMIYVYCSYIFLNCISYTIYGIAHTALLARMTREPHERITTSVMSGLISMPFGILAGSSIPYLSIRYGWRVTGIALAVVATALILIPGVSIKEVVGMEDEKGAIKKKPAPLKEQLPGVLKNKYFYLCILVGAITLIMNANAGASQVYYCNVVLKDPMFMMQMMAYGQIPGIIIMLVMPWATKRFSTRNFMLFGTVVLMVGFALPGITGPVKSALIIGAILRSVGSGPIFAGTVALIADAVDYGEWKTGIRSEGLMSASQSLGSKIGIGFGSAMTGWILGAVGYNGAAAAQTVAVQNAIIFDYTWLGAILSVAMFITIFFMDVEKYLPEIRKSLLKDNVPVTLN